MKQLRLFHQVWKVPCEDAILRSFPSFGQSPYWLCILTMVDTYHVIRLFWRIGIIPNS